MQRSFLSLRQGDRIVRIFAYWAIDYFGQFFENYRISTHTLKTFSTVKVMHSFWSKMSMGYILGVFFTNSSGHPALYPLFLRCHLAQLFINRHRRLGKNV
jgi:hypothetical protein